MLPSYFNYIFVHLKQKARLRPKLSPKFLSTLSPNPAPLTTLTRCLTPKRVTNQRLSVAQLFINRARSNLLLQSHRIGDNKKQSLSFIKLPRATTTLVINWKCWVLIMIQYHG